MEVVVTANSTNSHEGGSRPPSGSFHEESTLQLRGGIRRTNFLRRSHEYSMNKARRAFVEEDKHATSTEATNRCFQPAYFPCKLPQLPWKKPYGS